MPRLTPIQSVEAFHLAFLRILEAKVDRSVYVVKGGVNLRAWFGSLRYSVDLDLDLLRGEGFELRDRIDALLGSPQFRGLLKTCELDVNKTTKPKQTETTQRWKIELTAAGHGMPLHTKIEFSRRGSDEEFALEPALADIVRPYGIPTPTANHYIAPAAIRQKICALARRRETQARDVWDLDHLFRTARIGLPPVAATAQDEIAVALDRVIEMPFEVFKAQVVPYLAPDSQDLYDTADAWARMQALVVERLLELKT